ncbi:MAG: helix-turn-helix domain-containing protein [Thermosphaera sp.]
MGKDIITMSKKEVERLKIIHRVMDKRLTQVEAGNMMGISDRQVRRIIARIRRFGDQAIVHGNRGRPSPLRIPKEKEEKIVSIVEEKYYDFGPTFAAEKLMECEGIKISREKLRQFMISHGIWHPKKKKKSKIHQWRERKHHRGEMLQMDGSDHDWLEGRGPRIVLRCVWLRYPRWKRLTPS